MRVFSLIFFLSLGAFANECSILFAFKRPMQTGVYRIESLGGVNRGVYDLSDIVTERQASSDPNLRVVDVTDVVGDADKPMFLGFGRPNVFLGLPPADNGAYKKVGAKSLKRGDTKIEETKNRVQSGLLLVFPELQRDAVDATIAAAEKHEGTRRWTCVNANCAILSDAGFTIGGQSLKNYYFPVPLLRDILRHGLEYQGQTVRVELVKTTPGYLESVGLSIDKSVWTTLCRHGERACQSLANKAQSVAWLAKIKQGAKSFLGVKILGNEETRKVVPKQLVESTTTEIKVLEEERRRYDLAVSEPSSFGSFLRLLWGPYSLFQVKVSKDLVNSLLPEPLNAYPDSKPSFVTRLKKDWLFNPTVIRMIRSQMFSHLRDFSGLSQTEIFGMLRTDSPELPNKYNFVITGDDIIVSKIDISGGATDWILSKHVLMAGWSKDVRFAGEVWKTADGVIHINNNSGTYKPDAKEMVKVMELFQKIFPGVKIQISDT